MENKLIEFGKYNNLGQMVSFNMETKFRLEVVNPIAEYIRCLDSNNESYLVQANEALFKSAQLILKELKDISDEDLKAVGDIYISESMDKELYLKGWENEINTASKFIKEIDMLRSKGYAIGIPKEYYITEEELKEGGE